MSSRPSSYVPLPSWASTTRFHGRRRAFRVKWLRRLTRPREVPEWALEGRHESLKDGGFELDFDEGGELACILDHKLKG